MCSWICPGKRTGLCKALLAAARACDISWLPMPWHSLSASAGPCKRTAMWKNDKVLLLLFANHRMGTVCCAHTGEKIWRMPMEDSYWEQMKSPIADMKNTGGRMGGAITAALFLREFVNIDKVRALLIGLVPPQSPQSHRVQVPGTCTVLLWLWLWLHFWVCREDHFGARFELCLLSCAACQLQRCLSVTCAPTSLTRTRVLAAIQCHIITGKAELCTVQCNGLCHEQFPFEHPWRFMIRLYAFLYSPRHLVTFSTFTSYVSGGVGARGHSRAGVGREGRGRYRFWRAHPCRMGRCAGQLMSKIHWRLCSPVSARCLQIRLPLSWASS